MHAKGVAEDDHVFDTIKPKIASAVQEALLNGERDKERLQKIMRRTLGRWVGTKLRRRAMIVPVIVEVD